MARTSRAQTDFDRAGLDEADLVKLMARQDAGALEVLARRHFSYAHAIAARLLKDGFEAEDIVQEVFLKLWTRPGLWQPGKAKFTTWLYRVVSNAAIDRLRQRRHDPLEVVEHVIDPSPGPETKLAERQLEVRIATALDDLPPRQKLALVLTYYQGCSNAESAAVMELSVDALESLLSRGRRKLRDKLAGELADFIDLAPGPGNQLERTEQ